MNDPSDSQPIGRLVPDEPFPPYAFVPGRFPHPTSDPAGHSFGKTVPPPSKAEPDQWQQCRPYLYGIDLFNAGYYWESHVAWESLWIACGRKGVIADFLKGLIHLAAAGVKALEGKPKGVNYHSGRAEELWRTHEGEGEFMGLQVVDLIRHATTIHLNGWSTQPPVLVPIVDRPCRIG